MRLLAFALGALCMFACTAPPSDDAGHLQIEVAPLSLEGVTRVCYALTITDGDHTPVVQKTVCSDAYGNGPDGDIAFVAPCNADAPAHTVTLRVSEIRGASGPLDDWRDPCPNGCSQPATCAANGDVPVTFDLVVMRTASQGFFDVAVAFDDIFCSAKVDCVDALVHDPATLTRVPSAVVAFSCTDGADSANTWLYMDDVVLRCGDDIYVVDAAGGKGNVYPGGVGAPDPLVQAVVAAGTEQQADVLYWTVALGLDTAWLDQHDADCVLETRATAASGQLASGLTPAATNYPYIDFAVPLTTAGAIVCSEHPLDGGNGVRSQYTGMRDDGSGFESLRFGNEGEKLASSEVVLRSLGPIPQPGCVPAVPPTEVCNGVDDDCDGATDETAPVEQTDFELGTDGWTLSGDGKSLSVVGGTLYGVDAADGRLWYYVAPPRYGGNRSDLYGGTLAFRLRTSIVSITTSNAAIYLEGNGKKLRQAGFAPATTQPGTAYSYQLLPGNWIDDATGQAVGETGFRNVLANVTAIRILGEWYSGVDRAWLDDVTLAPFGGAGGGSNCSLAAQGQCGLGLAVCQDGELMCEPLYAPTTELCNTFDDDCDGQSDDVAWEGDACITGLFGVCRAGVRHCAGGLDQCQQQVASSTESCNGLDDDCDNSTDENNPGGGGACATGGQGVCAAGTMTCTSGSLTCHQNVQSSTETCNSKDDNCNGTTDDVSWEGNTCSTGLQGVCAAGIRHCVAGSDQCQQQVFSGPETCNGKDDNCSGATDEGNPGGGAACSTGQLGVCAAGTTTCTGGSLQCVRNVGPSADVCNGLDDNCDGFTDSGCTSQSSDFSSGLDGWTFDNDGTNLRVTAGLRLGVDDAGQGGLWGFVAPPKFRGDLSGMYGGSVVYDLQVTPAPNLSGSDGFSITGANGVTMRYPITRPTATNATYTVPVSAGSWTNAVGGAVLSEAEMRAVLANVTKVRVRGEWSDTLDSGFLDNFRYVLP